MIQNIFCYQFHTSNWELILTWHKIRDIKAALIFFVFQFDNVEWSVWIIRKKFSRLYSILTFQEKTYQSAPKYLLLPTDEHVAVNPNLKQNPGY